MGGAGRGTKVKGKTGKEDGSTRRQREQSEEGDLGAESIDVSSSFYRLRRPAAAARLATL